MQKRMLTSIALLVAILINTNDCYAKSKRVALIVGNSHYSHYPTLQNPVADATELAEVLQRLGVDTQLALDLNLNTFLDTISHFKHDIENTDLALFFYAGHGVEVSGKNYLVPTDQPPILVKNDIDFRAFHVKKVLNAMKKSKAKAKVIILDACRGTPFKGKTRGDSDQEKDGLASIEIEDRNVLIAFATSPGKIARDGSNENHSPYSKCLYCSQFAFQANAQHKPLAI